MVVIVDLGEDVHDPHAEPDPATGFVGLKQPLLVSFSAQSKSPEEEPEDEGERPNPNINGFSAALSCYPIVSQLARQLDLNSLHDLASTCRQFRANLLQYRKQLIAQTLRCSNEEKPLQSKPVERFRESHALFTNTSYGGRILSGRVGQCARDMVGECRRCGTIVCRNCTTKPPPTPALNGRHRRLCQVCIKSPLSAHTAPRTLKPHPTSTMGSPNSSPLAMPSREPSPLPLFADEGEEHREFTWAAFTRTPCCCDTHLWLCHNCGYALHSMDSTYMRGWTWRTKYSTYLGGLGTGIGEGNEGVQCGRGSSCLAARTVEQELDLPAEEMSRLQVEMEKVEAEGTGRSWRGASWGIQECEGVGGGVRKKLRKLVRVGAVVKEFEDERDGRREYLQREKNGERRSWCAWCERVIVGAKDIEKKGRSGHRPPSSGSDESSLSLPS